jgi:N6-adenosine-specific RNA methylase IME4
MPDPFLDLSPPYATIVADPPWQYEQGGRRSVLIGRKRTPVQPPPYPMMPVAEIAALPVADLVGPAAHLYLWTTNRYLYDAHDVARAWGFRPSQTLVWCKVPKGIGPGGAFSTTTEFILYCRRGTLPHENRVETTWFQWPRGRHSVKPAAFGDVVERVSPGPYVELFARSPRLGWDSWGHGYDLPAVPATA